jgi:ADP-heptose:LPS heptosyltransferase
LKVECHLLDRMEKLSSKTIHTNCKFFKGDLPCKPNKEKGYECNDCPEFTPISKKILIIKLGAIGDVIRTTPLLRKLKSEYSNCHITWLTHSPAILPSNEIDSILKWDLNSVLTLSECEFDILINLDKDKEACALANKIKSQNRFGYILKNNVVQPANELANHKYLTGLFDGVSKSNTKSYVKEIFELTGFEFNGEEYVFESHDDKGYEWDFNSDKKRIGLNTGCGDRWTTRLWPDLHWQKLIELLQEHNFQPVLLGGEQENEKNIALANQTGATYFGHFPLQKFINLVNQMDLVVTQVTMAMHISVALRKKMVLMNNIFNPYEFEMYGRGEIIAPRKSCECYFQGKCKFGASCMNSLEPEQVLESILKQLKQN